MRKFQFSTLIAALLVSGSMWGTVRQVASLTDLNNAVKASSSGDTIQLTAGWTNSDNITLTKNVTLDLNGFTIGMASSKSIQSATGATLSVDSVIIKNGTINGTGQIFFMRGMRKMIVENVTINNTNASGNFCISSATVDGTTLVLKGTNTFSTMNNKKPINIGKATTIENFSSGLTLSDINMGVDFSLNNQVGGVLNISAAPTKKVTLTNNGTVNISAGSFTSSNLAVCGNGTYNISGGTFENAIWEAMTNKVIAQGKVAIEGESSVTIQDALTDGVAKINRYGSDIFFANLADAASAVKTGETITITKDYVEQQNVTFTKACVVDLNGKQIEIYSWYEKVTSVSKSSKYIKVQANVEFKNGSLYAEGNTNSTGIINQLGNTTMTLTNVNVYSKHNNGCVIKFETANSQTLVINAGTTIKSDGLTDIMKNSTTGATNDVTATIINNANLPSLDIMDYNFDENCTTFLTFNVTNNAQIGNFSGNAYYLNLTNTAGASATLTNTKKTNFLHFYLNNAGSMTFADGKYGCKNTTESFSNSGTIAITGGRYGQNWYNHYNLDSFVDGNICEKFAETIDGDNLYRILKTADIRARIGDIGYSSVYEAMTAASTDPSNITVIDVMADDTCPGRVDCENKKMQINMNGKKLTFSGPSYGLWIQNTILDFEGVGELEMLGTENYEGMFYMIGNYPPATAMPYNHLTIGKDIVVNAYGDPAGVDSDERYFISLYYLGHQVDIHGTINCIRGIGNWYTSKGKQVMSYPSTPIINIDGQLIAEQTAIYNEINATYNISGDAVVSGGHSGIESIAGVFNVTGGTIESTYSKSEQETKESIHGNTTTVGAGIVLYPDPAFAGETAVVNLNAADGKSVLVNGQVPVKVANPNEVATSSIGEMININVENAKLQATYGQTVVAWAVCDDAIVVSGGKFSHVPSYVVEGKSVVDNLDSDKDVYPYAIGAVNAKTNDAQGTGDIIWEKDVDWKRNGEEQYAIPVSTDQVTIANGQNVIVTGKEEGEGEDTDGAFAYSINIADGGQLVVKSGAKLVVGKGGINEADKSDKCVIVEDGGILLIEPTADVAEETGKVEYIAKTFKRNDGWEDFYDHGYQLDLFGNPIDGETGITANPTGYTVWLNTWNPNNGWQVSDLATFKASTFTGFMFWNNRSQNDSRVKYTFSGKLVGNKVNTMQFNADGYKCFANSYTAPIDVKSLLQGVEGDLQRAVYIYIPENDQFIDINNAKLDVPTFEYRQIAPMQGFFIRNLKDTALTAPIDYVSMVWSPAFQGGSGVLAPKRNNELLENTQVRIQLMDNTANRKDYVFLVESEQYSAARDASDTEKMMNGSKAVNIYANTALGALSTMQTNDLDGQELTITTNPAISYTMTFDWIAGEELYLYDAEKNIYTLMTENSSYEFIANASSTISNRFSVVKRAPQVVTSVDEVESTKPVVKGIYSIMGHYLGDAAMWNNLPAGVYIVNGQKIVK